MEMPQFLVKSSYGSLKAKKNFETRVPIDKTGVLVLVLWWNLDALYDHPWCWTENALVEAAFRAGVFINSADGNILTHWGRVTHICVSKLSILGSDNGLSPGRRQAII